MATVRDILAEKGGQILSISQRATVLDAALIMNDHKIGSLIVLDHGKIQGIVTERDVLRRVVAEQLVPEEVTVGDIMTTKLTCCTPDSHIDEASSVMKSRKIRHLPVVDANDCLLGMISIGDINAYRLRGQETTIHFLSEYLYGNV